MAICKVEGCHRQCHGRMWCQMHYQRWWKYDDPLFVHKPGRKLGAGNKNTLLAMARPSLRDLAWVAGFLEGEGSFGRHRGCERVAAKQVNREPIDRMLSLFGGAAGQYQTKTSPVWQWSTSGARARGVMLTLYPMLSARRQGQIRHAMGIYVEKILPIADQTVLQTQQTRLPGATRATARTVARPTRADRGADDDRTMETLRSSAGARV